MADQYIAKWGNKGFIIRPDRIVPLLGMSTALARKQDTGNDTSGTPTTNTRGMELQSITLETRYVAAANNDIAGQIADWKAQFNEKFPLYINGKQFGPKLLELSRVDVADVTFDNLGRMLTADVTITLQEYSPPTTTVSSKQTTATTTTTTTTTSSSSNAQATKRMTADERLAAIKERRAKDPYWQQDWLKRWVPD